MAHLLTVAIADSMKKCRPFYRTALLWIHFFLDGHLPSFLFLLFHGVSPIVTMTWSVRGRPVRVPVPVFSPEACVGACGQRAVRAVSGAERYL